MLSVALRTRAREQLIDERCTTLWCFANFLEQISNGSSVPEEPFLRPHSVVSVGLCVTLFDLWAQRNASNVERAR